MEKQEKIKPNNYMEYRFGTPPLENFKDVDELNFKRKGTGVSIITDIELMEMYANRMLDLARRLKPNFKDYQKLYYLDKED